MSNTISFTGKLGRDSERKFTPSGAAVLSFSVANDTGYGDRKQTNWLNCQIWGKRAEGGLADYLVKGAEVFISGELTLRKWTNKDGIEQLSPDVNVVICDLIGGKKSGGQEGNHSPEPPAMGDDVPF